MPHVASETITHAFNHKPLHPGRPPQASDRAQATPFESLLDNSAPSTPDRPPAAEDNASRTGRSHRTQRDARADDRKAAKSHDDTRTDSKPDSKSDSKLDSKSDTKPDATSDTQSTDADADAKTGTTGKPDDDCKTTDDGKAAAHTMTTEQAANIDGSNPISDDKPVVGPIVVDGSTAQLANNRASWSLNVTRPSIATVTIKDATGQTAYTGTFAVNPGNQGFTWDGHGNDGKLWPDGAYTLTANRSRRQ